MPAHKPSKAEPWSFHKDRYDDRHVWHVDPHPYGR